MAPKIMNLAKSQATIAAEIKQCWCCFLSLFLLLLQPGDKTAEEVAPLLGLEKKNGAVAEVEVDEVLGLCKMSWEHRSAKHAWNDVAVCYNPPAPGAEFRRQSW